MFSAMVMSILRTVSILIVWLVAWNRSTNASCSSSCFPCVGVRLVYWSLRFTASFVICFHWSLLLAFSLHFSSSSAFHRSLFTQSWEHVICGREKDMRLCGMSLQTVRFHTIYGSTTNNVHNNSHSDLLSVHAHTVRCWIKIVYAHLWYFYIPVIHTNFWGLWKFKQV